MATEIRSNPCLACPYRKDVPSGIWAQHEYDKLREYDEPTMDQPMSAFSCHATPERICNGWAVVHNNRGHEYELIALRVIGVTEEATSDVALYASGNEAADYGERDIEDPSEEAKDHVQRLMIKYPRLR
jgi:hypothetical protein